MALGAVVDATVDGVGEVDAYLLCRRWISFVCSAIVFWLICLQFLILLVILSVPWAFHPSSFS